MFLAIMAAATAGWTIDNTYDALSQCADRAAKDYAITTSESVSAIAEAAVGACMMQEAAFALTVEEARQSSAAQTYLYMVTRLRQRAAAIALTARLADADRRAAHRP